MYSNLLTSVDDEEVQYWSNEIDHYRQLLEMHSLAFDTTKLAASRMKLLVSANYSHNESSDDVAICDTGSFWGVVSWKDEAAIEPR